MTTEPVSKEVMYEQGSKTCQQYSELVTRVRTLAQQLFIAFAVGAGIAFARSDEDSEASRHVATLLLFGGVGLALFAGALWVLNHHYSIAFGGVRDALIELEKDTGHKGPWEAHKEVRLTSPRVTRWAWHGPFAAVVLTGCSAAVAASWVLFGPVVAFISLVALVLSTIVVVVLAR